MGKKFKIARRLPLERIELAGVRRLKGGIQGPRNEGP